MELLGPDHKIVVSVFDDPSAPGVACYLSRAKTGGLSGMVGLAEDSSDAAIACRQVGPITLAPKMPEKEEVFTERRSVLFKHLRVVRFYDRKRNTLVYLSYSDKLIKGSPKNSISSVPIMPWPVATKSFGGVLQPETGLCPTAGADRNAAANIVASVTGASPSPVATVVLPLDSAGGGPHFHGPGGYFRPSASRQSRAPRNFFPDAEMRLRVHCLSCD